jgi:hypothetical protein
MVSAYRIALDQTTNTIDSRARYFRNLVVMVVVLTLGSIGWAAVAWSVSPLATLLLLLPLCGLFFFLDAKILNDWRSQLLDAWIKKDIEFCGFCDAASAIPTLPKDTLQSMLATLPSAGDLPAEQRIASSTREAVAALTTTMHACQSDALALKASGFAIATGSLVMTVILWMWQPLLASVAVPSLPLLRKGLTWRRLGILRQQTFTTQRQPDFDHKKYAELVASLPCEMAAKEK